MKLKIAEEEIIIRRFQPDDSITEITKLLHRSYKQLAEMGFRYLATHQDDTETESRLKKGISYLALVNGQAIATISLYYKNNEQYDSLWYKKNGVAHFGQFAVLPEYQKKGSGSLMLDLIGL
jgi:GNAT superfamily N-acetyltransferase